MTAAADVSEEREIDWVRNAPSDVLHAALAVGLLVVVVVLGQLFDTAIVTAAARVLDGLESLPRWMLDLIAVVGQVLVVALLSTGVVVAVTGRHWRLLGTSLLAAGAAAATTAVTSPLIDARRVVVAAAELPVEVGRVPSAALLAAATAIVAVTVTSLPRLWRRLAWSAVITLMLLRFLGTPVSFDAILAVLAGWATGAVVVVVAGAPSRRPRPSSVLEGLSSIGVELDHLELAAVDARGSTPYFGTAGDGTRYFIKVLGEDERSADLLFRVWRYLQPRDLGDQRPFSSLRRGVEHEALVSVMARQFGVRTPLVAGFSTAHPNGYVLVYEAISGRSLDALAPEEMTDDVLEQAWTQLAELRRHGMAHRDLRLANVFLDSNGRLFLIDFGFSELAAEDLLLQTDVAELLSSSAVVVGAERSVAAAVLGLGPGPVVQAAPRLVPGRLSGATRTAMKADPGLLDDLRERATAAALPDHDVSAVAVAPRSRGIT